MAHTPARVAGAYPKLTRRAVVRTHRLQLRLREPVTPYYGMSDLAHLRLWRQRRWAWYLRDESPVWVIRAVFQGEAVVAIRVAACESGLDPHAKNPSSTASGLFQILGGSLQVWPNTTLAHKMYLRSGWTPWTASEGCWG